MRLKEEIVARSIDDDQQAVAKQWAKTFHHSKTDKKAVQIAQFMVAAIAKGEFQVRDYLSTGEELFYPSRILTLIDYLSHASRIIFDYQALSIENQQELLAYFPLPEMAPEVTSRSATHGVDRQTSGRIIELKGFLLGLLGQLPTSIKTARDFGIDIAMGGEDQRNANNKIIAANGYSGHLYFHRYDEKHLLMAGLEQSAPATSALHLLWGESPKNAEEQFGTDQFEQGHSLVGASDVFTAAGSLYFSDPVYQAKLMVEKDCFPPDKYGAMQVRLTDKNWPLIKDFLVKLQENSKSSNLDPLVQQLLQKPASAVDKKTSVKTLIALDFAIYLQRIYETFIAANNLDEKKTTLAWQNQLLAIITTLQKGQAVYQELSAKIKEMESLNHKLPNAYIQAIKRIETLFLKQLSINPQLQNVHKEILLARKAEDLQSEAAELLQKINLVREYFATDYISSEDDFVASYRRLLDESAQRLKACCSNLTKTPSLESSWTLLAPQIEESQLQSLITAINNARQILQQGPKLYSSQTVQTLRENFEKTKKDNLCLNDQLTIQELYNKKLEELLKKQADEQRELKEQQEQKLISLQKEQALELARQQHRYERRVKLMEPVLLKVKKLEEKAKDLGDRGEMAMEKQASGLARDIRKKMHEYYRSNDADEKALQTLQKETNDLLDGCRDTFEAHRGIKETLLAIAMLFVGYLLTVEYMKRKTKKPTFFLTETDSIKKLNQLQDALNNTPIEAEDNAPKMQLIEI